MLGIGEFRRQLSARLEAAHWEKEPTIVRHDKRKETRAALVPLDVGPTPLPLTIEGEAHAYVVSREWYEKAVAALGKPQTK